jgi:hypothetical protein
MVHQPDSNPAADRAKRRLQNVRGTLGAGVNLDGTVTNKPLVEPPLAQKTAQPELETNFYFGCSMSHTANKSFRHGPGLSAVIYSDSQANLDKKKMLQQELGEMLFTLFE